MKKIVLGIEGMHCEECVNRLTKVLNGLDGINDSKVSLENKNAEVEYDEDKIDLDDIKQAIEDAGFEVKEQYAELKLKGDIQFIIKVQSIRNR